MANKSEALIIKQPLPSDTARGTVGGEYQQFQTINNLLDWEYIIRNRLTVLNQIQLVGDSSTVKTFLDLFYNAITSEDKGPLYEGPVLAASTSLIARLDPDLTRVTSFALKAVEETAGAVKEGEGGEEKLTPEEKKAVNSAYLLAAVTENLLGLTTDKQVSLDVWVKDTPIEVDREALTRHFISFCTDPNIQALMSREGDYLYKDFFRNAVHRVAEIAAQSGDFESPISPEQVVQLFQKYPNHSSFIYWPRLMNSIYALLQRDDGRAYLQNPDFFSNIAKKFKFLGNVDRIYGVTTLTDEQLARYHEKLADVVDFFPPENTASTLTR